MESCDVTLPQPVEYIDTICLDKSVILTDGCGTATLTTENGEALPVTFIVSQQILDNSSESVKEIIAANDGDIIPEAPSESFDSETANVSVVDDTKTVYAVHFPAETKNEVTDDGIDISENGAISEDKSVISENSLDNEFHDQSDIDEMNSATNLEDFMDVVTTYKCRFCRFSCHWKSGLVSHIRCCHIAEKKCIVTVKSDKEPNIVTATKEENEDPKPSSEEDPSSEEISAHKIENIFSINSKSPEINLTEDMNISKSPDYDTDSEPSSKGSPILERHIFLCGQCSDGFMTLDECKQHMVDAHNIKLDKNMIKPLRKRGRPRTRPYNNSGGDASCSKESKRTSRPPKNLEDDYDFGLKKKPRRETLSDKIFR